MSENSCPNYKTCRLINSAGFNTGKLTKEQYIPVYCINGKQKWESCKRFQTKEILGFCPDFVLPDTNLTMDEIIDKFDENSDV